MKKFIILAIVFMFVFSLSVVSAGPAYEKLKAKKMYLIHVVKWNLPESYFQPIAVEAIGIMEKNGFLKTRFSNESFDLIFTRYEFVYSNLSFKTVAKLDPFSLALRLSIVTRRISQSEFSTLKGLFVQDLASKGLTRMDIKHVFETLDYLRSWNVN